MTEPDHDSDYYYWDAFSQRTVSKADKLDKLGDGTSGYEKGLVGADPGILETFPNPMSPGSTIQLGGYDDPKEFTSLCPKTGQPDFARIVVRYKPKELCIESKSWKLFLASFRDVREFHEACVQRIADALAGACDPDWLEVVGEFTPRGGISINPKVQYRRPPSVAID